MSLLEYTILSYQKRNIMCNMVCATFIPALSQNSVSRPHFLGKPLEYCSLYRYCTGREEASEEAAAMNVESPL
jgi:hypothetical protein